MSKNTQHTAEGKLTPDDMLSGSQVAAVLGYNPYMTANQVLKRAFDAVSGIEPPKLDFEALHWGSTFELPIINEVAQRLGLGNPKTTFNEAFFHKDVPLAVSLDGMVKGDGQVLTTDPEKNIFTMNADEIDLEGDGIIEVKLTSHELEHDLPYYRGRVQLQAQMDTVQSATGKPIRWGAVGVLYRGITLRIFVFKRDEEMIKQIRDAAVTFDAKVQKYKQADETEWYDFSNSQEAAEIFDTAEENTMNLNDHFDDKITRILEIKQDIKDLETEAEHYQAQIMAKMGDYKYANTKKFSVQWGQLNYKATPSKVVPAKPARSFRSKSLKIKEL